MILSAQSIRQRRVEHDPPLIAPFTEQGVSPGGNSFGLGPASYDVRIDQDVIVPPHGFLLASTVETRSTESSHARIGQPLRRCDCDCQELGPVFS
jgi:deoxycytidine triphosphate deaminase